MSRRSKRCVLRNGWGSLSPDARLEMQKSGRKSRANGEDEAGWQAYLPASDDIKEKSAKSKSIPFWAVFRARLEYFLACVPVFVFIVVVRAVVRGRQADRLITGLFLYFRPLSPLCPSLSPSMLWIGLG